MRILKTLTAVVLAVVFSSLAYGQGVASGDLHVTVRDPKGSLVANASVRVRDEAKGIEHVASANSAGVYSALALPPSSYMVIATAPGFATTSASHVVITVGSSEELPIVLSVAATTETVEVSSEADLVETTRTSTTDTVNQQRIENLPINGRNYINFTLTDSQVVRDNAPSIGAAPTSGLNMSGQRGRSNLVNVDGADATDNSVNGVRSTVSQEAVQEFQIITNGYSPEYGRAAGGVVNIVTRSGENAFHGDVFGYLRNRNFQAVNPFSTVSNPAYTRVQAGAAFGGAIKKDKTFYFFSYEITRRHETGFASIGQNNWGLVPFDASSIYGQQPGTFLIQVTPAQAAFLSLPLPPQVSQPYAFLAGGASGIAVNGKYPTNLAAAAGVAPQGDPERQFPSSCNAQNPLCNGLPASFLSLGAQAGNFPVFEGTSVYSLRLDHQLNNAHRLTLRSNVSPSTITGIEVNGENQVFGQNSASRASQQTYRDAAGVAQDTWMIGNNKVNELRFQYARRGLSYFYSSAPGGSDVAVNIPGFAFTGREPYSFIQRTEQRYQFSDNLTWALRRHSMKMGVDFNDIKVGAIFTVNYGAEYGFGALDATQLGFPATLGPIPVPGFSPVQAYGLGIPSTVVQGVGNPQDNFSNKPLGVFWQDSWRARQNLTLNYGVRYDVEFPPQLAAPTGLALAAYNQLGLQKGIQTDTNNVQPRVGIAWSPGSDGKTVIRSSYGIFYDHPLLGLYFLGDASDGSKSGQLLFAGGSPCNPNTAPGVSSLNATNIFQGILSTGSCLPNVPGYLPNQQRFDSSNANLFINQNYLNPASFFPLAFQPFGYPQSKNFVYAYSQQVNLTVERDLGHNFSLSVAYNFNGGGHLNRPINANTTRGDLLVRNWQAAVGAAEALGIGPGNPNFPSNPLFVGTADPLVFAPCGASPAGQPYVPAALTNFFRPSGLNPAIAAALLSSPAAGCVGLAQSILQSEGLSTACDPTTPKFTGCVPFSDMDANYSNGSSVYHGMTVNLRKRFSDHYEFLGSYTWSHAIDDSTDLQSPLAPQDSFFPSAERSSSLFDQRHRFVFSGVYQSGKHAGENFASRLLSDWTVAPIIEVASGRPFNILTGNPDNFQFSPYTGRPNVVPAGAPDLGCGPAVSSKFSPTGFFQEPCFAQFAAGGVPTLQALDGTFSRNGGIKPWVVFNDLRVSRKIFLGERFNLELSVDMFNIANKFNVADVNQLFTSAGQATAAYDPRQFQFGAKIKW